jgi:DNA-binding transcriptional ArsR family regulator
MGTMKSTAAVTHARRSRDERLDLVFGALSDRTRRALLSRLEQSPAMVTELAEPFDMSLPAVSKHLRVLERAGLVTRTIDGRVHNCALDTRPLAEADRWMERYRALWEDALDGLATFVEKGNPE